MPQSIDKSPLICNNFIFDFRHQLVVANLLATRRTRVVLVTSASDAASDEVVDVDDRVEIESIFVANIAKRHGAYIDAL
jgi:hypothetical protein